MVLAAVVVGSAAGCQANSATSEARPATTRSPPHTDPKQQLPPVGLGEYEFRASGRVVAIGDLHGDVQATRDVLRLAGAIDETDQWIGGDLVVVQTGDQLDRGDSEMELLSLLDSLQEQAPASGGAVHVLVGNHETMNVAGDYRYVASRALAKFTRENHEDPARLPAEVLNHIPVQARARALAFFPGGSGALALSAHPVVIKVNDSVFVHGGVLERHLKADLVQLNRDVRAWFRGEGRLPRAIMDADSPVWTRKYSEGKPSARACKELSRVLKALGAKRMVVGHSIQKTLNSACNEQVWRIDVGMSSHYGGTQVEALQIHDSFVQPLRTKKHPPPAPSVTAGPPGKRLVPARP